MPRYIDLEQVKFNGLAVFDENLDALVSLTDVRKALQMTPTADVVEVVRCRECKFWEHEDDVDFVCAKNYGYRTSNDFCSCGERRE